MIEQGRPTSSEGRAQPVSLRVRSLDDTGWYEFVESHADATAFHHPAWARLLAKTYGYRPLVLVAETGDGEISAGLPMLEVRSRLTGRRFHSLPFTDHCPPLARTGLDLSRLTQGLAVWRPGLAAARVQVHAELPAGPGRHSATVGVRHLLNLEGGRAEFLARLNKGHARGISKAQREGVQVRISTGRDGVSDFYRLLCQTRKRLGAPVQPRRFFESLWVDVLSAGLGFAVIASITDQPIAASVFLTWKRTAVYKYGASDARYLRHRPNNLVMWTALDWAFRHDYSVFDFGRTSFENRGLRDFKSRWGAVEVPLIYSSIGGAPPDPRAGLGGRALATIIRRTPQFVCRGVGELLYGHFA